MRHAGKEICPNSPLNVEKRAPFAMHMQNSSLVLLFMPICWHQDAPFSLIIGTAAGRSEAAGGG